MIIYFRSTYNFIDVTVVSIFYYATSAVIPLLLYTQLKITALKLAQLANKVLCAILGLCITATLT